MNSAFQETTSSYSKFLTSKEGIQLALFLVCAPFSLRNTNNEEPISFLLPRA